MSQKMRWNKRISRALRSWFRTKVIGAYGVAIVARTKNGLLAVEAGDMAIGRTLLRDGSYDWRAIVWLKLVVGNNAGTLVNAGAHIGSLLIPLSVKFQSVYAFEADPRNFDFLQMNLRLNGCNNVQAFNQALGDVAGSIFIERNALNTGNSAVKIDSSRGEKVPMVRLDECLPDQNIELMVMDVEGFEPQVLRGMGKRISQLQKLYIEFCPALLSTQKNDSQEFFHYLLAQFPYRYELFEDVRQITDENAQQWFDTVMAKPKHLRNILFCRQALNLDAMAFKSAV